MTSTPEVLEPLPIKRLEKLATPEMVAAPRSPLALLTLNAPVVVRVLPRGTMNCPAFTTVLPVQVLRPWARVKLPVPILDTTAVVLVAPMIGAPNPVTLVP